ELDSLTVGDFERILKTTDASLTEQYTALLATDGCALEFTEDGIHRMAEIAFAVNEKTENIGARRLYTVMEKLVEEAAFSAGSGVAASDNTVRVDAKFVDDRLGDLARNEDLARYVL
ncbi:MAG: HslU--HslV peptidase ATPase subunit, partial [Burkholderiaceae bacterium]